MKRPPAKDRSSPNVKPSEEFRAFWSNSLDPAWFEAKRLVYPFLIFILILIGLLFYLSSSLLFSPKELFHFFVSERKQHLVDQSALDRLKEAAAQKYASRNTSPESDQEADTEPTEQ